MLGELFILAGGILLGYTLCNMLIDTDIVQKIEKEETFLETYDRLRLRQIDKERNQLKKIESENL